MKKLAISAITAVILGAGCANANVVVGSIWENDSTGAKNAIPANVPGTTPDVTFSTVAPLTFSATPSTYTIGDFLASGNGSTILTGSSQLANALNNTLFDFKGWVTVTHGETFTAGHDDGISLVINGMSVINEPMGTSFVTTTKTYNGPTGTFPFQLVYGEAYGAPAGLSISLPFSSSVPEPMTLAIFGAGLAGAGLMRWRKKRS